MDTSIGFCGRSRGIATRSVIASPRGPRSPPTGLFRCVLGPASVREPPQQTQLAVEQRTCLSAIDLPAPRVCQIERAADLSRAAVRHGEESPRIAAVAAIAFGEIEHDTTRGAFYLVSGFGAVPPKLDNHGAQGSGSPALAGPPQIRTCRLPASGSSENRFARVCAGERYAATGAETAPVCVASLTMANVAATDARAPSARYV